MPDKEADNMAVIDATIAEVSATLDKELRKTNDKPEETKLYEAARDAEVSHPRTTTKTTRRIYNLRKGKNRNRGRD